jgi:hypothetical protein
LRRFVDGNVGVLVKVIKNIDSFVNPFQKAHTRENIIVKACVCYLLMALFARDQRPLDSRKEMGSTVDGIKVNGIQIKWYSAIQ